MRARTTAGRPLASSAHTAISSESETRSNTCATLSVMLVFGVAEAASAIGGAVVPAPNTMAPLVAWRSSSETVE